MAHGLTAASSEVVEPGFGSLFGGTAQGSEATFRSWGGDDVRQRDDGELDRGRRATDDVSLAPPHLRETLGQVGIVLPGGVGESSEHLVQQPGGSPGSAQILEQVLHLVDATKVEQQARLGGGLAAWRPRAAAAARPPARRRTGRGRLPGGDDGQRIADSDAPLGQAPLGDLEDGAGAPARQRKASRRQRESVDNATVAVEEGHVDSHRHA